MMSDFGKEALMEAHKIHGTAGTLSFEGISQIAGMIEKALKKAVRESKKFAT